MINLLKQNGVFYLSVPIGIERVEFNANWIFDPRVIVSIAHQNSLTLYSLMVVGNEGAVENMPIRDETILNLSQQNYSLGIFIFKKR